MCFRFEVCLPVIQTQTEKAKSFPVLLVCLMQRAEAISLFTSQQDKLSVDAQEKWEIIRGKNESKLEKQNLQCKIDI